MTYVRAEGRSGRKTATNTVNPNQKLIQADDAVSTIQEEPFATVSKSSCNTSRSTKRVTWAKELEVYPERNAQTKATAPVREPAQIIQYMNVQYNSKDTQTRIYDTTP